MSDEVRDEQAQDEQNVLCTGSFGRVVRDANQQHAVAAVNATLPEDQIDLQSVVKSIMALQHPNVLPALGVAADAAAAGVVSIRYAVAPQDLTLAAALVDDAVAETLAWGTRCCIALGITRALQHLHSLSSPVFHRDIASHSVVLQGSARTAKLLWAGASALVDPATSLGSEFYRAPEVTGGEWSAAADVYSLGMVFAEIVSGKLASSSTNTGVMSFPDERLKEDVADISEALTSLYEKCVAEKTSMRLETSQIVDLLEGTVQLDIIHEAPQQQQQQVQQPPQQQVQAPAAARPASVTSSELFKTAPGEPVALGVLRSSTNFSSLLASSTFGKIYTSKDGKCLIAHTERNLSGDVQHLKTIAHANIARVLAHSLVDGRKLAIAYERQFHHFLNTALVDDSIAATLCWDTRCCIALGITRALQYLHSLSSPVFHRDIASHSVVLQGSTHMAKLLWCGVAPLCNDKSDVETYGTAGYVAPEVAEQFSADVEPTVAADMYSLGVVFAEIVSGTLAGGDSMDFGMMTIQDMRLSEEKPEISEALSSLSEKCKSIDPTARPDTTQVIETLEKVSAVCFQCHKRATQLPMNNMCAPVEDLPQCYICDNCLSQHFKKNNQQVQGLTCEQCKQTYNFNVVHKKFIERDANDYFAKLYEGKLQLDLLIIMLKKYKKYEVRSREYVLYHCMIQCLFFEFRYLVKYPPKELRITAFLLGGLIAEKALKDDEMNKGLAFVDKYLHGVNPAKSRQDQHSLVQFAMWAFERYMYRLPEWSGYSAKLQRDIDGDRLKYLINAFPSLAGYLSEGRGGAPAAPLQQPPPPPQQDQPNDQLQQLQQQVQQPQAPPQQQPVQQQPQAPQDGGIGSAHIFDISTISSQVPNIKPPTEVGDRVAFLVNNIDKHNIDPTCHSLRELLRPEWMSFFSEYMVVKRASLEPNNHKLYLAMLAKINSKELDEEVRASTVVAVKKLLESDKVTTDSSEKTLLKNLGSWLGMQTIGRNKPLMAKTLDIKRILLVGVGQKLMSIVLPLVAKIMEHTVHSTIFAPPNPWTMNILYILGDIYTLRDIRLMLKFEVEVLCKNLNIDLSQTVDQSPKGVEQRKLVHRLHEDALAGKVIDINTYLKPQQPAAAPAAAPPVAAPAVAAAPVAAAPVVVQQQPVTLPAATDDVQQGGATAPLQPTQTGMTGVVPRPPGSGQIGKDADGWSAAAGVWPRFCSLPTHVFHCTTTYYPHPSTVLSGCLDHAHRRNRWQPKQGLGGMRLRVCLSIHCRLLNPTHQRLPPQEKYGAYFQTAVKSPPPIADFVGRAMEAATKDIIKPVVNRSICIARTATLELVRFSHTPHTKDVPIPRSTTPLFATQQVTKDFALDPDYEKMCDASQKMVKCLAAHLAIVTCKDMLKRSLRSELEKQMRKVWRIDNTRHQQLEDLVNDNLDACMALIEKVAIEQASVDMKEHIEERKRKGTKMKLPDFAMQLPDNKRGIVSEKQLVVYDDFDKMPRSSNSSSSSSSSSGSSGGPAASAEGREKTDQARGEALEKLLYILSAIETETEKHYQNGRAHEEATLSLTSSTFTQHPVQSEHHENIKKYLCKIPNLIKPKYGVLFAKAIFAMIFEIDSRIAVEREKRKAAAEGQTIEPPCVGLKVAMLLNEVCLFILQSVRERNPLKIVEEVSSLYLGHDAKWYVLFFSVAKLPPDPPPPNFLPPPSTQRNCTGGARTLL